MINFKIETMTEPGIWVPIFFAETMDEAAGILRGQVTRYQKKRFRIVPAIETPEQKTLKEVR